MADKITDPKAKQAMLDIATNYERIARRAEARRQGIPISEGTQSDTPR